MKTYQHVQFESLHFYRSKFKVAALVLFIIAGIYGLQNGYTLFQNQHTQIASIEKKDKEKIKEVTGWFDSGKKGPEDKDWIDITTPYWANTNAPITVKKMPSALMPFNTGQTEQYGYSKPVNYWSTSFDSDLSAEIANPERLSIGTLDFSFVIIYLLPILIIILLFNIGGLEKDLNFFNLIRIQDGGRNNWLMSRYLFYFLLILVILVLLILPYAIISGAITQNFSSFVAVVALVILYTLLWFILFYFISKKSKGSADQSIKMVAVWVLFCVLLPGFFHQALALKYPASYMVDFLDANRDKTYEIYDLPKDSVIKNIYKRCPQIVQTKGAKDTIPNDEMISAASGFFINDLMKSASQEVENRNQEKNRFIQNSYWLNPVGYFQNRLNGICDNDYYAYQNYRKEIQLNIDKKVNEILLDAWNKEKINKKKYLEYLNPTRTKG